MSFSSQQFRSIKQLSDRQMAVLQRVAEHKSSKEIARELDISPHTVDQRVKRIHAILGVGTRSEAARIYLAASGPIETNGLYQGLIYQSPELPQPCPESDKDPSLDEWNPDSDRVATVLRESQAVFFADAFPSDRPPSWKSVLFAVERENALKPLARTFAILIIILLSLLALSALISLAEGFSRIL
jgi:DNA-binding CsgD family transcriptional regulator